MPLLRDCGVELKRTAIFQHFPECLGARVGPWPTKPVSLVQECDWKLLGILEEDRFELHNLRDDIGVSKNLAATMPDRPPPPVPGPAHAVTREKQNPFSRTA